MSVRDIIFAAASGSSGGNPNAWDISKAYYSAGTESGDLSAAVYAGINFSVSGQESIPSGIFFKPDGTKMYVCGTSGDDVNEYTLSSAWVVSSASYVQNFSVSGQDTAPASLSFKPDGTKMYVLGGANDRVYQYSLSTPWDLSTASYDSVSFSVSTQEATPTGMFFKPDGTKMYITGTTGDDVNEYNLGTAWNVSTASYVQNFSVAGQEVTPVGVSFTDDGEKMYIIGSTGDDINEYSLSTAWNISTASYVQNFSISGQETNPADMYMRGDGALFVVLGGLGSMYQYIVGGFSVSAQDGIAQDVAFKPDGTKMFIIGDDNNSVYEYSLSTPWDINTASYVQSFSVASQETNPTGIYFKPDGTTMFICGTATDAVYEYALPTPWSLGFVNYVKSRSVSSQDSAPTGVFFRSNGESMYIMGSATDNVWEYTLTTSWDISTASSPQAFSVNTQESAPTGFYFRTDGALMFVTGTATNKLYSYSLSTAWDVTSASVSEETYVGFGGAPSGVFFNPDGTQFFVVTPGAADRVFSYLISPT